MWEFAKPVRNWYLLPTTQQGRIIYLVWKVLLLLIWCSSIFASFLVAPLQLAVYVCLSSCPKFWWSICNSSSIWACSWGKQPWQRDQGTSLSNILKQRFWGQWTTTFLPTYLGFGNITVILGLKFIYKYTKFWHILLNSVKKHLLSSPSISSQHPISVWWRWSVSRLQLPTNKEPKIAIHCFSK